MPDFAPAQHEDYDGSPVGGMKNYQVTFKEAGAVGVWTKADSVTYFDNLKVMGK